MGKRVLVIGGGQLARMMQQPAIALGINLRLLTEDMNSSAAQVIPDSVLALPGQWEIIEKTLDQSVSVATFEHEHIPAQTLHNLESRLPVHPAAKALCFAQDKLLMREKLADLGFPVPRFRKIETSSQLDEFIDFLGGPVVLKTARGGYDGKGVRIVNNAAEAKDWIEASGELIAEEKVEFSSELAVLVARRSSGITVLPDGSKIEGEIRSWPVVQTIQKNGICYSAVAPAPSLPVQVARQAEEIAIRVAQELDVTGVMAVEMFWEEGNGRLLINELAMRPHNSGHWTIDGAVTSQFEQHLRAVCDLPLGDTALRAPYTVMVNLLGSSLSDPSVALAEVMRRVPQARVHLYGKTVRVGRKLGHVNVLGDNYQTALEQAELACKILRGE
ncbi:5-(carboxyamino)imidazole ribonucleotide synthase [Actinomycetaceae bacterium TAE3-ERU4]|nr:5-(carboxyamino)imidazole ribonucleotide synthase [Actinomycetaceae bacterium TAE3-ERU4]